MMSGGGEGGLMKNAHPNSHKPLNRPFCRDNPTGGQSVVTYGCVTDNFRNSRYCIIFHPSNNGIRGVMLCRFSEELRFYANSAGK